MQAKDIMTAQVVTIRPDATVQDLANLLVERAISAVPVVDEKGSLLGIVSEGDLVRRSELGTARVRSWWLRLVAGEHTLATDFIKANARKVADVMTRDVITAAPEATLGEIARLLEKHAIKRVPIVDKGRIVGLVSRANLVQAYASLEKDPPLESSATDGEIREEIIRRLDREPWAHTSLLNVFVKDGVVDLWGFVNTDTEKDAVRVAVESTRGVTAVNNNLALKPADYGY